MLSFARIRPSMMRNTVVRNLSSVAANYSVKKSQSAKVSSLQGRLQKKKDSLQDKIIVLDEVQCLERFKERLKKNDLPKTNLTGGGLMESSVAISSLTEGMGGIPPTYASIPTYADANLTTDKVKLALDAGLATFVLHVESRKASLCGEGFYTIGPCGEEMLAGVPLALQPHDAAALHYRHLSSAISRQLLSNSMEDVILARARGFTVSTLDPVGGGTHCLLGGGKKDFLVTSTLASQTPPAVGRAIGGNLAKELLIGENITDPGVSYVSLGDGSINNAHFLSGLNMAEYSVHRGWKCPLVVGISDNGLCISLRGYDWLDQFVKQRMGGSTKLFFADGSSLASVYDNTHKAVEHSRKNQTPSVVVFKGLNRRFGHAATDRQAAYMEPSEVESKRNTDALLVECTRAIEQGITTSEELLEKLGKIESLTQSAFAQACEEPKIESADYCINLNSQPELSKKEVEKRVFQVYKSAMNGGSSEISRTKSLSKPRVMRKNMTDFLDEFLSSYQNAVYLGEDVEHGGYYTVTEGLFEKYGRKRIHDLPPDETSLIGLAMGYSQSGLLPIVEIPYAKYLDCGADMFFESIIMNWLSAGKQPNGLVIRLQGFDRGVFGGNFHTHNSLYLPPGLDVLCFSNGVDWVRGMRNAISQAEKGRVVMLVDSTDLLNRRHILTDESKSGKGDKSWIQQYPTVNVGESSPVMDFSSVRLYKENDFSKSELISKDIAPSDSGSIPPPATNVDLLIVSYGNGIPQSLRAKAVLEKETGKSVHVVDVPYLSSVPEGLEKVLVKYVLKGGIDNNGHSSNSSTDSSINKTGVLFADPCKLGQHPLGGMICSLQQKRLLPVNWNCIAASPTYNPLGRTVTFLNESDIVKAGKAMI